MRYVGYFLLAVVVVVAAAFGYLYFNLNTIVAKAIRSEGTRLTGTSVSVSSVSLSPFDGKGTINGLKVANPPGYAEKNAIEADRVSVHVSLKSLRTPVVVVHSIVLAGPRIDIESKGKVLNLEKLQKNIEANTGGEKEKEKQPAKQEPGQSKKVSIGLFQLTDGQLHMQASALGSSTGADVKLEKLVLENIGGDKGATPGEAAKQIVSALIKAQSQKAVEAIKGKVKERAQQAVEQGKQRARDAGRQLLNQGLKKLRR